MNKKKVAFFIGSLNRGGTETLLLDTLRKQDRLSFDCILIYRNEGDLSEDFRVTGVQMIRVKPEGLKISYIHQLRELLCNEKVSILHTQTLLNAFLGLFCVCFSQIRLVASFHGFFSSFRERLRTHLVMWFADASVFVSSYAEKWYLQRTLFAPQWRCHVVNNGIDLSKFDEHYPIPDFLDNNETNSLEQCVALAMVGNFTNVRSQLFICKCLKKLKEKGNNFHFYFIGKRTDADPERFDRCVKYCENYGLMDRVHFIGGRKDVPAILQYIDGFIYSSDHDTFGIAVVEAMVSGVPVIVNDWEVMKEITDDGKLAILYNSNDEDDCVNKIEHFIHHRTEFLSKASQIADFVKKRYSIESHINSLLQVYNLVLE